MPSAVAPEVNPSGSESIKDLEWANLVTLDLSQISSPSGKEHLVAQISNALQTTGTFAVKNYGIAPEVVKRHTQLGSEFFDLPLEEKMPYFFKEAYEKFDQKGYKPIAKRLSITSSGVEIYNIPRQNGVHTTPQPPIFKDNMKVVAAFQKEALEKIIQPLLQLTALALELPEDTLTAMNSFSRKGEDMARLIKYHALSPEEIKNGGLLGGAHADMCTFTLNFNQPVASLQVQEENGDWKWVKPWDDSAVVTVGSALTALTSGWAKGGMHRLHAPPKEQIHMDRLAVLFIARGDSDFVMESIKDSPILAKMEEKQTLEGMDQGLTVEEWDKVWLQRIIRLGTAARAEREHAVLSK